MTSDDKSRRRQGPTTAVRILSILAYTGFAIPVSIVAMVQFGVLGLVLAAVLAWQWTRVTGLHGDSGSLADIVQDVRPDSPTAEEKSSGNASFDAYRTALMERLEQEQESFEGFLTRLRAAKDKAEFDEFLDARARKQLEAPRAEAPQ